MSIILNFFGVKPVYACELVSLVPGRELKESSLQSVITAIYDPISEKDKKVDNPKVRILQRGLASSIRNLLDPSTRTERETQGKNTLCDAIFDQSFREGNIPYSFEEHRPSKMNLLTKRTDGTHQRTDIATGNIRKIELTIPTSTAIPHQFWPFSFIDAHIEPPKEQSVVRIIYDVDLFDYRKRGCGAAGTELPLFTIPYTLFSPERIHHELIRREIRAAMSDFFSSKSALQPHQLEELIDTLKAEVNSTLEIQKKQLPRQDLLLYVDTNIATYHPCQLDGVNVLSTPMEGPYAHISIYRVIKQGETATPGYSFHVDAQLSNRKTCEILGGVVSVAMKESIPALTDGVVNGLKPSFEELGKSIGALGETFKEESRLTRETLQKK